MCLTRFGRLLSLTAIDPLLFHVVDLPPFLLWRSVGISSHWDVLKDYADGVLSLPATEAENERVFSILKYVIGE
jgi:hypothetical protein